MPGTGTNNGPGLCLISSKIKAPHLMSAVLLSSWYNDHLIPRLMATGALTFLVRGVASEAQNTNSIITIYSMSDFRDAQSDAFKSIFNAESLSSGLPLPPGTTSITELVEIDYRIYQTLAEISLKVDTSVACKAFALVELQCRVPMSAEESAQHFKKNFGSFLQTAPSCLHAGRYFLEDEWWSAGSSLYSPDLLDLFTFDQEAPDYYTYTERLIGTAEDLRLDDFTYEVKTFRAILQEEEFQPRVG